MTIFVEEKKLKRIQSKSQNRMKNHSLSTIEKGNLLAKSIGKNGKNLFSLPRQSPGMCMWNC